MYVVNATIAIQIYVQLQKLVWCNDIEIGKHFYKVKVVNRRSVSSLL